ncbi:hypothetical protein BCR33DRAFT_714829 [Rhizoclosmatium globosum]|uniref:Uncharacterized protein n=1 Tax=Rhizoclosmatium globosum TaxID=329046 RepID=A0A1Y2CLM4_9FUNG|nr:hypothetical protein BCR33DRAFT_714829 [Rhizoclosmatium globosum]|eukprot:ORY47764.1 hypothetical protein BCR33DRAFT_714829 [Rhizoclosmatium globosum]
MRMHGPYDELEKAGIHSLSRVLHTFHVRPNDLGSSRAEQTPIQSTNAAEPSFQFHELRRNTESSLLEAFQMEL